MARTKLYNAIKKKEKKSIYASIKIILFSYEHVFRNYDPSFSETVNIINNKWKI